MVSDRVVPGGPARMGSPRVAGWRHHGLRSVVTRPYAGITGAIEQPGGFVFPATASVLLVMKVEDPMLAEATRLGIDTDGPGGIPRHRYDVTDLPHPLQRRIRLARRGS